MSNNNMEHFGFALVSPNNESRRSNTSKKDDNTFQTILFRGFYTAVAHPLEYAKILIQIGYEPLEPVSGRSIFGRVTLFYPNLFKYISYIVQRDGYLGLYRGLSPRLMGYALSGVVYQKVTKSIRFEGETPEIAELPPPVPVGPGEEVDVFQGDVPGNSLKNFLRKLVKDLAGRISSVIVSQPFMVVAARTCAQFVGRESVYKGILPSFREIFSKEGIQGLFAGITPRLIGEVLALVLSGSVAFAANQFIQTKELRGYVSFSVSVLATSFTYPFHVVSTTMAVNNARIVAGLPPVTPLYGNWYECWRDLGQKNQLKRGANSFYRIFPGPKVVIGGMAYPVGRTVTELPDLKML